MATLADSLPYRQFLKGHEGVIDERDNGIVKGYRLIGPSPDSDDAAKLLARAEQFGRSPVHLRTGDAIQVVFDRQPAPLPPDLHYARPAAALVMAEIRERFAAEEHWITPTRLYLSHQFGPPIKNTVRAILLGGNEPQHLSNHDLLRAHALGRFQAIEDAVKGAVGLEPMSNLEMFRDLLHLVTYHDYPAVLPEPHVRLNQAIACEWQVNGLYPVINGWHLRPIVITAYPSETLPQMLSILLQHPGYLTLSIRYRCLSPYDAQKKLEKEKPFWNQTAIGDFIEIIKSFFGAKKENTQHAYEQIAEIQEAINASKDGTSFGTVGCVAIVRDRDPAEADYRMHTLIGLLQGKGVMCRPETIGAAKAIRTTLPGYLTMRSDEHEANRHKIPLTGENFADLAIPAKYWEGTPYIHSPMLPAQTPAPLVCGGTGSEPFYFPTHIGGVANQLILGPVGSGKSSLIAAMVCAYLGIPKVRIAWLDLDYSSFVLSHLLGIDYRDMGAQNTPALCPLAMLDKEDGVEWLFGWFERLFARWPGDYGVGKFELDEYQSEEFASRLRQAQRQGIRTMSGLFAIIPGEQQRIRRILRHYTTYWKHIFNGEPQTDADIQLRVFEMRGLQGLGKRASAPATELILHSIVSSLDGVSPAWIFADEFWNMLGDEVSAEWLFDSIRTMRKRNCGFVGATQSAGEIVNSPFGPLLLESAPAQIFLPNSALRSSTYVREAYTQIGLNDHELNRIGNAVARQDYYFKSSIGSRMFTLALGPTGQKICASTGYQDVQAARQLLEQGGDFLEMWLTGRGQPQAA
jgi:type IV secretion system protein VirB4